MPDKFNFLFKPKSVILVGASYIVGMVSNNASPRFSVVVMQRAIEKDGKTIFA